MRAILIISMLTFLCIFANAQERFNNVIYDPDANISNTVVTVEDGFVVLTGTSVNGGRGIGFTKVSFSGEMLFQKNYKLDNLDCYEGDDNCLKISEFSNLLYLCGTALDVDYNESPFIVLLDMNLDTIAFQLIDVDSVYGAYDIIQVNDSLFAMATANIVPDDYEMGLLLINIYSPSNLIKNGYGVDELISNEVGAEIIKTHDNNLLLGGFTFGFSTSTYKQDWYLVKTDSIGTLLWERHHGNPSENDGRIMAMLESKDSAYIVAGGQAICNWSMNPISEAALRKIDTAGNLIWERFYRNYMYRESASQIWFSDSYCADIIELEDGDFAGLFSFQRQSGSKRFMLIKLNSVGDILWTRRLEAYNSPGTCIPSSIKKTDDGGFILHGYGEFDTGQQFWLVKTDSLGNEGALYLSPPPENVECPDFPNIMYCNETYNSRLRVQGKSAPYTLEFSTGEIIENLYYPSVFIPEIQGTGSFTTYVGLTEYPQHYDTATIYTEIPSDDYIELPFSLTVPENYFGPDLTVTITNGFGESYEITLPVYVDCNVSAEQITEISNISIYPNPASDFLQISLPQFEENSFVKIINAQGQAVLVEQLFNAETKLNIRELAAGSYVVRVYVGNKISNMRFEKL
jgi:hypothetical protein